MVRLGGFFVGPGYLGYHMKLAGTNHTTYHVTRFVCTYFSRFSQAEYDTRFQDVDD